MTTGYAKADVEQWHDAVHALVQAWAPNSDTRQRVEPILALLKAAALEGTKVPGLVAEVAAARSALDEDGVQSREGVSLAHRIEALSEDRKQEKMRAEDAEAKVSALQARVAELERQRDGLLDLYTQAMAERSIAASERDALKTRTGELEHQLEKQLGRVKSIANTLDCDTAHVTTEVEGLKSERDALRAKLEDCRAWIRNMATEHGGRGFPCSLMDDDVSALAAETTAATE